ncbi:type II secretion system minor pseudopilin GspH [Neiella marina]|uniref:Type II secretion system protein H n=1 Tax=Neiella holothuriorum TaxID=2870530 RepID=A0ABS7EG13_9GAMM|nr:type II secretion system minor pseudopilin GspH [Neiella holothuriorum]MBW8191260.1 type II secretion system minor pseudopilin GspH [Neiella holothuriorum]
MGRAFAKRNQGFTLLEVLVVVMIIAFVSGGMVMALSGSGPEPLLQREAARFRVVMQLAADRAMLTSEELGLRVTDTGYDFVRWEQESWQIVNNSKGLAPYEIDENIGLEIELDGLPWEEDSLFESEGLFENAFEEDDEDEKIMPQVFIYSYGEFTDFSLTFSWLPLEDEQPQDITVLGQIDEVTLAPPEGER